MYDKSYSSEEHRITVTLMCTNIVSRSCFAARTDLITGAIMKGLMTSTCHQQLNPEASHTHRLHVAFSVDSRQDSNKCPYGILSALSVPFDLQEVSRGRGPLRAICGVRRLRGIPQVPHYSFSYHRTYPSKADLLQIFFILSANLPCGSLWYPRITLLNLGAIHILSLLAPWQRKTEMCFPMCKQIDDME